MSADRQIALTYALSGAAEIEASGGRAIGLSADVRNYEALRSAVEQAHATYGPIDIVVAMTAVRKISKPATRATVKILSTRHTVPLS